MISWPESKAAWTSSSMAVREDSLKSGKNDIVAEFRSGIREDLTKSGSNGLLTPKITEGSNIPSNEKKS